MHSKLISICIATYKREKLLSELLESLIKIIIPDNYRIKVIIVDNDKNGSAKEIVESFKNKTNLEINYLIQPVKNISLTRNIALENAKSDFIAFIDDDEIVDKYWLYHLVKCLGKFNADGVFGLVLPRFEEGIPDKYKKREYYFSPMDKSGSEARYMFTGSVLFKSDLIQNHKILFDPRFGLTGGEDADFFNRIKYTGVKLINCREAISYEYISKERTTSKFFLLRNVRGGQTYVRTRLKRGDSIFIRIILLTKSILKIIYGGVLYLLGIFKFHIKIKSLIILGSGLGEFLGIVGYYKLIHK